MRQFMRNAPGLLRVHGSNLAVFAVLGGILYLGHRFDWKVPRLSAEAPTPAAAKPSAELKTTATVTEKSTKETIKLAGAETLAKANIQLRPVKRLDLPEYVSANGSILYDKTRMAQLSTRAPGTVWQVVAKVGDRVAEGDVLAIIESVEVGKAKSEFLQAVVLFERKEKMLQVAKDLDSVIAKKELYEIESQVREARIQKVNAQQTLINLGLPIDVSQFLGLSDDQLIKKLHTLGLPSDWAQKFDPARTTANLIPLRAPFAGQVIGTDLVKGESISPGQPRVVITNTDSMWLVLEVGIEEAGRLRLGQEIAFVPDGMTGGPIVSKLSWISTEADPKTRRVQVRAEARNHEGQLRANAFGAGKIKVRTETSTLAVPHESLHWDLEIKSHVVFLWRDDQNFDIVPVRLGVRGERVTEVFALQEGKLREGQTIAGEGSYLLKSELLRSRLASGGR